MPLASVDTAPAHINTHRHTYVPITKNKLFKEKNEIGRGRDTHRGRVGWKSSAEPLGRKVPQQPQEQRGYQTFIRFTSYDLV